MWNATDRTGTRGVLAAAMAGAVVLVAAAGAPAAGPGPMERERLYEVARGRMYIPARAEVILREAMGRDDAWTKVQALHEAVRYGLEGMSAEVIDLLGDGSPVVRAAAAEAADAIDARGAADALLGMVQPHASPSPHEVDQTLAADRALARWGDARGVEAWAQRLSDGIGPAALRVSAARALGRSSSDPDKAWGALAGALADAERPAAERLASADALAELSPDAAAAVGLAERLADSGDRLGPLLGARLLRGAESEAAVRVLLRLAADREPAVQAAAMARLLELDPSLLWEGAEAAFASADPKVRLLTVRSFEARWEAGSIAMLAEVLNDPHPEVRRAARGVMVALAGAGSLREAALGAGRRIVEEGAAESGRLVEAARRDGTEPAAAPHWRAAEQAALLLGELDDKASAERLIGLFDHHRPEVPRAAVIALRPLEVAESYGALVALLERTIERAEESRLGSVERMTAERLAYELNQTLGVLRIAEADPLLRQQIERAFPTGTPARTAAIWALGLIHEPLGGEEREEDLELSRALIGRVNDMVGMEPEQPPVRLAAAVALGRMRAESQLDTLRMRYQSDPMMTMEDAARWAVMNITGEELPPIRRAPGAVTTFFLAPLDVDDR